MKISFNNFKSFGENLQTFSKKPITLIYGANSIGKSAFLHSILYNSCVEMFDNQNLNKVSNFGDEIDFGGFLNLVHKHDKNRDIRFSLQQAILIDNEKYDLKYEIILNEQKVIRNYYINNEIVMYVGDKLFPRNNHITTLNLKSNFLVSRVGIDILLNNYQETCEYNDLTIEQFYYTGLTNKEIFKKLALLNSSKYREDFKGNNFFNLHPKKEYTREEKDKQIINKKEKCYSNLIYNIFKLFENANLSLPEKIHYFSPLRHYPNREEFVYNFSNDKEIEYIKNLQESKKILQKLNRIPTSLEILSEENKFISSRDIWGKVAKFSDLRDVLNLWLSDNKKLKSTYKIVSNSYYKIDEKDIKNLDINSIDNYEKITELKFIDLKYNTEVTLRDMGLGISQILPILASCFANFNTTMFIEQPELHLHPALQCEIADEFIKSAKNNKNEFFIETHSEHLLLRIMKRLMQSSEGKILKNNPLYTTPNDICLIYVDSNEFGTFLNELELSEDGNLLDPWPNGFFEEGYKERFCDDI